MQPIPSDATTAEPAHSAHKAPRPRPVHKKSTPTRVMDTEPHVVSDGDDASAQLAHVSKSSPPAADATEDGRGEDVDADAGHSVVSTIRFSPEGLNTNLIFL